MSIIVAVNATDGENDPQAAVCQSAAQHNNCGEYNNGVGGVNGIDGDGIGTSVDDNDDTAVFDHENMEREHDQLEKDWRDLLNQKDKEFCNNFSDFIINKELNEENKVQKWETKWNFLMSYIRNVYDMAMDGVEVERYPLLNIFKETAYESKSFDSYHIFQNVKNLVMEFLLEARSRQMQILEKKNKDTPEMPQVFLFCLLDIYRSLMAATNHLKDVIKPIEEYHLSKFNLTWRMINKYLYHIQLYANRTIYDLVTKFAEKIVSTPILSKSLLSKRIIQDYTNFIQEVKLNILEWDKARTRSRNIKCNDIWAMLDSMLKEVNGMFSSSIPPNDDLVIDLTIPKPPKLPTPEYQERVDNDNCEDIDDDGVCNYCDCIHTVETLKNSSIDFDPCVQNGKSTNLQDNEDINSISSSYSNMKEKMLRLYSCQTFTDEDEKSVTGNITTNLGKKLPKRRTEYVKHMHHHNETPECSSGRLSQDDSCSEHSSSSPRQCDCCYCEVFGHGVPSVATVSRNYQETRDRLKNRYLLKKAKQTNETIKQKLPVHPPENFHQFVTEKTGAIIYVQQKKIEPKVINEKLKYNSENLPEHFLKELSEKPIDEIVNFIEGKKATNEKRAAKKAKRREKKEEIERIKKEEEEAERKRIEEVLKKQEIEKLKREEALKKEKKKGKNHNKQQKQSQQQKQVTNSKSHQKTKQQVQKYTQPSKKKIKQSHGNSKKESIKKDDKCKKDDVVGTKMVKIKRDSDSTKVTITFRGAVEDDVLRTLYDNEAIEAIQRLCDKSKQPQNIIEDKPNKKISMNRKNKKPEAEQPETQLHSKPLESVLITKKNALKLPTNRKRYGYDYEESIESVFEPKDLDGEMDDDERELEEFKRFCLQPVPLQRKEKVHLNIKDIVLKK